MQINCLLYQNLKPLKAFLTVAYLYGCAHPAATVIFHLLIPVSAVVASSLSLKYMQKKEKENDAFRPSLLKHALLRGN